MSFKATEVSVNIEKLDSDHNEMILEFLSEGICRIDLQGRIDYANRSAKRMLRCKNSDIIGKHYAETFFAKDKESFEIENDLSPIDFVLKEGETSHVKTETFYKKDFGTKILVEYICVPLLDEGEIKGAVISFQDVTERRDVEIAISEARDSALEAARAKAAFLANMSHEIRTPLSGIVGTADLLIDSNLTLEQRKYAEMLKKSTGLLTHIVNEILDFSKIEAGKFEREKVDFNIQQIAEETIEFFKSLIDEKELSLELDIEDSVQKYICGDVNSIRQILNNFISNAIKFTESGKVVLKIAQIEKNVDVVKLNLSVTDTGIGIDKESREKLFQPFTQADSSMTRRFGGTGLGLAICKQLVEMVGGNIGVESKLGEGSTFWFECEYEIGETDINLIRQDEFKVFELKKENEIFNAGSEQELKILIVEDSPTNREITAEMLKQIGLRSESVENGLQAVKACMAKEFDLILMDCQMPEMDGFEATKIIRKKENVTNDPTIVAFTASVTASERKKCFNAGMDDYLSKPFTKQNIADLLNKHFKMDNLPLNLDLQKNMLQHSLSNIIEPKMLESLLEIESDQQGFVFEILDVFFEHAEEKIIETKTAIANEDIQSIKDTAHNLKGSSGNVGLTNISRLFADLEKKAEAADWSEVKEIFEEITKVFNKTKQTILDIKV